MPRAARARARSGAPRPAPSEAVGCPVVTAAGPRQTGRLVPAGPDHAEWLIWVGATALPCRRVNRAEDPVALFQAADGSIWRTAWVACQAVPQERTNS
jgi:hypothetical protein